MLREGEAVLDAVRQCFFGPVRVSILLDANGANTTAAAAVLAAARHVDLRETVTTVLAATGPVGQRASWLLAREGARVRLTSRSLARAEAVSHAVQAKVPGADVQPCLADSAETTAAAMKDARVVISVVNTREGAFQELFDRLFQLPQKLLPSATGGAETIDDALIG